MSGVTGRVRGGAQRAATWFAIAMGVTIPMSVAADHVVMALFVIATLVAWRFDRVVEAVRRVPAFTVAAALFGLMLLGGLWGAGTGADFAHYLGKYKEVAFVALWAPCFTDPRHRARAWQALLGMLLVTLLASYASALHLVEIRGVDRGPENPTVFKNQITHNLLMAFAAFLFVMKAIEPKPAWRRWLYAAAALAASLNVLVMVRGRTGYLVLVVLALYTVFTQLRWRGRLAMIGVLVAAAVALFEASPLFHSRIDQALQEAGQWRPGQGAENSSIGERLDFYTTTFALIREHPLTGVGTGGFARAYAAKVAGTGVRESNNPHNQFLLITAQLGIAGLLLFTGWLAAAWWLARGLATSFERYAARGLVLAMATGCLFNSLLLDHTEGMLFCWLTAVLFAGHPRLQPVGVGAAREIDAGERVGQG